MLKIDEVSPEDKRAFQLDVVKMCNHMRVCFSVVTGLDEDEEMTDIVRELDRIALKGIETITLEEATYVINIRLNFFEGGWLKPEIQQEFPGRTPYTGIQALDVNGELCIIEPDYQQ